MNEYLPSNNRTKRCPYCAEQIHFEAIKCKHCGEFLNRGSQQPPQQYPRQQYTQPIQVNNYMPSPVSSKSKLVYVLLGLFLGGLGIHNFYAGYNGRAIVQLLLAVFTGWFVIPMVFIYLWVIIEIIVVTKDANGMKFS